MTPSFHLVIVCSVELPFCADDFKLLDTTFMESCCVCERVRAREPNVSRCVLTHRT